MNEEKTGPIAGECGGCGAITLVFDYFGDCICEACAADEGEEWPRLPVDRRAPPASRAHRA